MKKTRPIRIENDFAFVQLTQGKESKIDLCYAKRVGQYNWRTMKYGDRWYAVSDINHRTVYLQRFIMAAKEGQFIKHIDNDPSNNTRENLRIENIDDFAF